jgi:hypothetical protein
MPPAKSLIQLWLNQSQTIGILESFGRAPQFTQHESERNHSETDSNE